MYAVIKTGGKQYRVAANDKISVEKLEGAPGEFVHFTDVLLVAEGGKIEVGSPLVAGATVVGEIASQDKSPTVYIFKKRRRKHYRRRNGHRQLLTSVTITDILTGGAKPTQKAAEKKAAPAPAPAAPKAAAPKKVEPKPAPAAKAEAPKAAEPVAAASRIEPVKTVSAASGSHIVETVKGGTKVEAGSRVVKAVEGGHRTENVGTDTSHIMGTVHGSDRTEEAHRTATPVQGGHRTENVGVEAGHKVGTVAASKADDISLIGGIGPKIEKQLHEKGITTWAQIAKWTEADVERYNTELKLMGRIAREEWIEQAKELMAGKPPRAKTDKARKE